MDCIVHGVAKSQTRLSDLKKKNMDDIGDLDKIFARIVKAKLLTAEASGKNTRERN